MSLDDESFTRRGLPTDHQPADLSRAWKGQRVQDQKGGGKRQRSPTCLFSESDERKDSASVQETEIIFKVLVSMASS